MVKELFKTRPTPVRISWQISLCV